MRSERILKLLSSMSAARGINAVDQFFETP
jgi:hypothetical protein